MAGSDSSANKKKRRRSDGSGGETREERKERKRQKKEAKKAKKLEKKARRRSGAQSTASSATPSQVNSPSVTVDDSAISTSPTSTRSINRTNAHQSQDETQALFSKRSVRFTVSLLPSQLGEPNNVSNRMNKVKEYLNHHQWRKYSSFLRGILMHYSNIEFVERKDGCYGSILNELPHIHFPVKFTALLLTPKPGLTLDGVVSDGTVSSDGAESSAIIEEDTDTALDSGRHYSSHLSVLCFTFINASISGQELRNAGFEFDDGLQQWYQSDLSSNDGGTPNKKRALVSGTRIRFSIDKIHESGGTVSLEGIKPALVE